MDGYLVYNDICASLVPYCTQKAVLSRGSLQYGDENVVSWEMLRPPADLV